MPINMALELSDYKKFNIEGYLELILSSEKSGSLIPKKHIVGTIIYGQTSTYLSCRARAGGIIFAPILPTRAGNTPTSSTTVICRRSRPHCACWEATTEGEA